MSSTFARRIEILKLIGLHNQKKGLKEIYMSLKNEGIEVDIRTIQRDMKSLSTMFDIENDGNKDKPGWSWKKESKGLTLPTISPSVALTFKMAELYLKKYFLIQF
ncbi:hypothetical protein ACLKMH_14710 [Psychromonas sp. KJ10-10]|uniref:hypothetical protein n=1 Tax=Psychromonas sp. KJ10-10 TaxID=3391823 RepID=UPI0039B3B545